MYKYALVCRPEMTHSAIMPGYCLALHTISCQSTHEFLPTQSLTDARQRNGSYMPGRYTSERYTSERYTSVSSCLPLICTRYMGILIFESRCLWFWTRNLGWRSCHELASFRR